MEIKQQILEHATDQFMRLGIRSVSMDDLSSELGISKKTLYQYFENKQNLVDQSITRHIDMEKNLMAEIGRTADNALDEMVQMARHITHIFRTMRPTLIYDLQKYYKQSWSRVMRLHSEFISAVIRENIDRGIREELYRADIDSDVVSRLYVAKSRALVDENTFPLQQYDTKHLIEQHILYHLHGIVTAKGIDQLTHVELFK